MGLARALLFGLLGWIGGVVGGEVGVTDRSVLIGMTAPFSGPNGAYGLDMKMVINAYFRQINEAGGICSWIAAATSSWTNKRIMIPCFVY